MRTIHTVFMLALLTATGAVSAGSFVVHSLRPPPIPRSDHRPAAHLILDPVECDGALDLLTLFTRPDVLRHVRLDGIFMTGSARDSSRAEEVLRLHDQNVTVQRASLQRRMERIALGYGHGVVVITDPFNRVRLARPLPSSPAEYAALGDLLLTVDFR